MNWLLASNTSHDGSHFAMSTDPLVNQVTAACSNGQHIACSTRHATCNMQHAAECATAGSHPSGGEGSPRCTPHSLLYATRDASRRATRYVARCLRSQHVQRAGGLFAKTAGQGVRVVLHGYPHVASRDLRGPLPTRCTSILAQSSARNGATLCERGAPASRVNSGAVTACDAPPARSQNVASHTILCPSSHTHRTPSYALACRLPREPPGGRSGRGAFRGRAMRCAAAAALRGAA